MRIERDDLARGPVRALVAEHLADMFATTPPESVHALDLAGLREPGLSMWSAWRGEELLGCAALKELDCAHGELKSMRTTGTARRAGVADALLRHLLGQARTRGYARVSLETGVENYFAPARALYARHGFTPCGPFGEYTDDPLSRYLTLALTPA